MAPHHRHGTAGVSRFAFMMVLALTTTTTVVVADCPLKSSDARAVATQGLTAAFEDKDFEVSQGAMWFFKHSDIDEDCEDCYYANPSSTYGCALLVRQTVVFPVSFSFRLFFGKNFSWSIYILYFYIFFCFLWVFMAVVVFTHTFAHPSETCSW